MTQEKVQCNCCGDTMEYKQWLGTHIWSCNSCPIIQFEYYNAKNVKELEDYFNFK